MKYVLGIIAISLIIVLILSPYFSLLDLHDLGGIENELREIKEILKHRKDGDGDG